MAGRGGGFVPPSPSSRRKPKLFSQTVVAPLLFLVYIEAHVHSYIPMSDVVGVSCLKTSVQGVSPGRSGKCASGPKRRLCFYPLRLLPVRSRFLSELLPASPPPR